MESTLRHATSVTGFSSLPFLRFKPLPLPPQLNFPILHRHHRLRRRTTTTTTLRLIATASPSTHHQHDHDHSCSHHHHEVPDSATGLQGAVIRFAKATRWIDLANVLREHLHLCCLSAALFVGAAACPFLLRNTAIRPVQNALLLIAFPLVGVSAALDAAIDISGGKVNIHVLMALAAFASIFMGNALEGGLLLAMFNLAHIAEEFFTSRSMVDVKELKENNPDSALVLNVNDKKLPDVSDLSYKSVPVHDVEIGSFILVRAGEAVPVDCEVFQGSATITTEHLTGEIKPIETKVGDIVPGGARNVDGRIIVKATKTWKESTLSKIVQLTEEAHLNKPKLQRWLDEFGEQYSKVVVELSLALLGPVLFKWPFMNTPACRGSIYRALRSSPFCGQSGHPETTAFSRAWRKPSR